MILTSTECADAHALIHAIDALLEGHPRGVGRGRVADNFCETVRESLQ